jgi:hypothetical protein
LITGNVKTFFFFSKPPQTVAGNHQAAYSMGTEADFAMGKEVDA